MKPGDDSAWAQPGFDDSSWKVVSLAARSLDARQDPPTGFVWYRMHLRLPAGRPAMGLGVSLPESAYEVFINGRLAGHARIGSALTFHNPAMHFVPLPNGVQDMEIAVRTRATAYFRTAQGKSDPFYFAAVAPAAMAWDEVERNSLRSLAGKGAAFLPEAALDLMVVLGGLAVWALYLTQRTAEYLWLSIYLVLIGLSDLFWSGTSNGQLPYSFNSFFADPVIFIYLLFQIEFTFAFVNQRPSRMWRTFQAFLVLMAVAGLFSDNLGFMSAPYGMVQAVAQLVVSLAIPILLLVWFRRGNREAGWLILPSLLNLPGVVADLGWIALLSHSTRLDFLNSWNGFVIGSVWIQTSALMNFIYLMAIGIVLFFRYTRVAREQTRASAELEAARDIQAKLVPVELPEIEGFQVKAAYVPAAEVGGDFFQVLRQENGSVLMAVGDVSGKGLRAAMTGTLTIGALRTLADEGMRPGQLLTALNRQLCRSSQGGFVTVLCARLAPDGTLTFANAGHLFPYRNGEEVSIETGVALGIVADATYVETTLCLEPGDSITFLSDGVVEARRADGELFGFARTATVSAHSPEQIAQAAQEFGQEDDITVLSLAFVQAGA